MAEPRRERKVVTVLFAEGMGIAADEAFALLQAGTDGSLRTALDYYRSVGATRYIRQAEAGLAAIA